MSAIRTTNSELLCSFDLPTALANDFLEKLGRALDWQPLEAALHAMYPANTVRPPCAPPALWKTSLVQHCHGLSDPQCGELVAGRWSWRRPVGLGWQERVPEERSVKAFPYLNRA